MANQMRRRLPSRTGVDAAGVVDEVGDGVSGVAVGDAVFGTGSAMAAEYAVLSQWVRPSFSSARQRGITVIGTASQRNQDYLRSHGAIPTTYGAGLVDRVRALAPDGVNAALEGPVDRRLERTPAGRARIDD